MSTKKITKMTAIAGECLKKAVREELQRKALLGQYVIIERNGKPCRILAKQALKIANSSGRSRPTQPEAK